MTGVLVSGDNRASRIRRRVTAAGLVVATAALVLSSFASSPASAESGGSTRAIAAPTSAAPTSVRPAVATSGIPVLAIGTQFQVDSLNPFVAVESSSLAVFKYIYPSLVQYDPKSLDIVPNFATRWSHSANGLVWTFHVHSGGRWSDGRKLTAEDVAWTVDTVLKYATGGGAQMATYVEGVKSASAPNAKTVIFRLESPEAAFLANLARMPVLPRHIWSKYASGKDGANLRTFSNDPTPGRPVVSGGPFACTQYSSTGVDLFTRNRYFYGERPTIGAFGIEYFTSSDAEIQALKSGQIDVMLNAPPSAVANLKGDRALAVDTKPALNDSDLIINDYSGKKHDRELLNPLVHQAFNYAINRKAIARYAFNGDAAPGMSLLPMADKGWYDPAIKAPRYSISKANALLKRAGYKVGRNGVRIANGHQMSYTVILSTDEEGPRLRAFDIIQSDFAKIGVRLTVRITDDATAASLELTPSQKFDLGMWGWTPPGPDPSFMLNTYSCDQFGGWQETGYCSKAYDRLYAEQATALNVSKRRQIVFAMQKMIARALPEFMYVYENVNDIWNRAWSHFGETPDGLFSPLTVDGIDHVRYSG